MVILVSDIHNCFLNKKTVSVMHLFSTYNVHIQDSFLLFFGNAWFLVFNFFIIRMILKIFKDSLKNYTVYLYAFSIFYLIIAPLFIIYSSIYHPLLGGCISGILFLISAYSLIFIQKKKGQD